MKNLLINTVLIVGFVMISSSVSRLSAQAPTILECGQSIESVFTANNQRHNYVINGEPDQALIIYAEEKAGNYEDLKIDTGLWAPNGFEINSLSMHFQNVSDTKVITTDWLSSTGEYSLAIQGETSTGSAYVISLSCLDTDGHVTSATHVVNPIRCGEIVENTFTRNGERHRYYIYLEDGDQITFTATALSGNYEDLKFDTGLWAPNGFEINGLSMHFQNVSNAKEIATAELSVEGVYSFSIQGETATTADYEVRVTCALANGSIVNPGDFFEISREIAEEPLMPFSGFGFPGLAPVDFTNVARLPIPPGIPMSGAVTPTGSEILGYQFDAEAGDTVELSFNRLSGNLNLGLVVIDSESNVIYQASLVTTQSMTARFTVPTAGQYTAGIFRINLLPPSAPEPTAFQVIATVNP